MSATMRPAQGPHPGGARQKTPSTPASNTSAVRSPAGCGQDRMCIGLDGCVGACDPVTHVITACATCDNTTFTDCTQSACQP
jgi:hypothetical protein